VISKRKVIDLINYSHNRDDNFKKSSDDLRNLIDKFAEQKQLSALYDYFQKRYALPESVVKQKIKKRIATSYIYRKALFDRKLALRWIFVSIVKHFGLLFYALIYARKRGDVSRYKLIVDGIAEKGELLRFKKLIDLFGKKNVMIIASDRTIKAEFPDYNIQFIPRFKHYDILELLKSIWHELSLGVWLYLRVSISLKINLFPLISPVVNDHLQYSTLFKSNRADYIIQERHYSTSAVKNHLFKKFGGKAFTCIQKNLLQLDMAFYYCDIDYLFSLGHQTSKRFYEYGGRIGQVIPVGSLFMEYYWFNNPKCTENKFDVVMLGINAMNGYERMDSYSKFMDDYYDCSRWLVRFKKDHPSYRIAIKHHSSAGEDKIENEIISGSGIELLPKAENSYAVSFSSKSAVTYGSTMGYELNAHGVPTLFIDPGYRCTILPDRGDALLNRLRTASYESFRDALLSFLNGYSVEKFWSGNPDDLCLNSTNVSERIYKALSCV